MKAAIKYCLSRVRLRKSRRLLGKITLNSSTTSVSLIWIVRRGGISPTPSSIKQAFCQETRRTVSLSSLTKRIAREMQARGMSLWAPLTHRAQHHSSIWGMAPKTWSFLPFPLIMQARWSSLKIRLRPLPSTNSLALQRWPISRISHHSKRTLINCKLNLVKSQLNSFHRPARNL